MEATDTTTLESVVEHYFPGSRIVERHIGGMGVVAKVSDGENQTHAVKLVEKPRKNIFDPMQLAHPNIAAVYKIEEDPNGYSMVMEWVEGTTLNMILDDNKRSREYLTPQVKREIAHQLLNALSYLEDKGLVNGDIKTDNIIVTSGEGTSKGSTAVRVKIIDIDTIAPHDNYTDFSCSPHYASPEQRKLKVEKNTDIYSLGIVLFELLTGENPVERVLTHKKNEAMGKMGRYSTRTYTELYKIVRERAKTETELALVNGASLNKLLDLNNFEPKVRDFFNRLLARSEDRYQTVDEVRRGLEESGLFGGEDNMGKEYEKKPKAGVMRGVFSHLYELGCRMKKLLSYEKK